MAWRVLLLALLALAGAGCGELVSAPAPGPAFLPARRAVWAPAGGEAELVCRVRHLGDKTVSWVRARDLQILAHAGAVFSADPRVAAAAVAGASAGGVTHTLRLRALRPADAGRYECQINTDPKLSQIYDLTVTEGELPRLEVWAEGPRELRVRAGGLATLACAARLAPAPAPAPAAASATALALASAPLRIAWLKDGRPLLPQGGVSLDTERGAGRAGSRLALGALAPRAAGRYTCRVALDAPDAATAPPLHAELHFALHVLDDDGAGDSEAMQRDQAQPSAAPRRQAARALLAAPLATLLAARQRL